MADDEPGAGPARRTIRGKLVAASVSIVAIAALVLHLADPRLRIDGITVGLLVVAVVPWLGDLIETVELPGGVKFELRRLNRRMEAAQRSAAGAGREARMAVLAANQAPDVPPARPVFPPEPWNRPPVPRPPVPRTAEADTPRPPSRSAATVPAAPAEGEDTGEDAPADSRVPDSGSPEPAGAPAGGTPDRTPRPAPAQGPPPPPPPPGYGYPAPDTSPHPWTGSDRLLRRAPGPRPAPGPAPGAESSPEPGGPRPGSPAGGDPHAGLVRALCAEYDMLRATSRGGRARTAHMDKVFAGLVSTVPRTHGFDTAAALASADGGERLAAYAGLYAAPEPALLHRLVDAALAEPLPYSQYWAFVALGHVLGTMDSGEVPYGVVRRLNSALDRMPLDSDRVGALEQALTAAGA